MVTGMVKPVEDPQHYSLLEFEEGETQVEPSVGVSGGP